MIKAILLVMLFSGLSTAQDKYMELSESDIESKKMSLISGVMNLSEEEAEKFWPIYRDYESERNGIGEREIELLKRYVESY